MKPPSETRVVFSAMGFHFGEGLLTKSDDIVSLPEHQAHELVRNSAPEFFKDQGTAPASENDGAAQAAGG